MSFVAGLSWDALGAGVRKQAVTVVQELLCDLAVRIKPIPPAAKGPDLDVEVAAFVAAWQFLSEAAKLPSLLEYDPKADEPYKSDAKRNNSFFSDKAALMGTVVFVTFLSTRPKALVFLRGMLDS